jgi:preprotein translocase SecE subunit
MGLIQYIKETQVELKHVSWPTRNQAIVFTIVVILVSVGTALFLGFLDFLLKNALQSVLG